MWMCATGLLVPGARFSSISWTFSTRRVSIRWRPRNSRCSPEQKRSLALLEVRDRVRSGEWDVVVVDCAPTAETLRTARTPGCAALVHGSNLAHRTSGIGVLRPILRRASGVPMPRDQVLDAIESLHADLADVRAILTEPTSSVRLVTTPEAVVFAEARRTLTSLSLYGYRVDGVLVNRIFPVTGADDWRAKWIASQAVQLARIESDCDPCCVWRAGYQAAEPVGPEALAQLAADVYGQDDPIAVVETPEPLTVRRVGEDFELSIALPLVAKGDVDLGRRLDELVVTVGPHRRVLSLPSALRRCTVSGAHFEPGRLLVMFTPTRRNGDERTRVRERFRTPAVVACRR